jgi:UDP-2,3-diacylglucosamine hydrolase
VGGGDRGGSTYFASDVHLRAGHPERDERFGRFVRGLSTDDSLVIVGDLCDFWFASREARGAGPTGCPALGALAEFRRRSGSLTILAGNHDAWLGPFYERALGVGLTGEPLVVDCHGLRVHAVHGHLMGARPLWKAGMESQAFLRGFGQLPSPVAAGLDRLLDRSNLHGRPRADRRHLTAFRRYAEQVDGSADIVAVGHLHFPHDESTARPRLVILGGWHHQASYLRIDADGARLIIEPG